MPSLPSARKQNKDVLLGIVCYHDAVCNNARNVRYQWNLLPCPGVRVVRLEVAVGKVYPVSGNPVEEKHAVVGVPCNHWLLPAVGEPAARNWSEILGALSINIVAVKTRGRRIDGIDNPILIVSRQNPFVDPLADSVDSIV